MQTMVLSVCVHWLLLYKLAEGFVLSTDEPTLIQQRSGARVPTLPSFVEFYVRLRKTCRPKRKEVIIFNDVVTNEGGCYNKKEGVFIAPTKGMYSFIWSVATKNGQWRELELTQNGINKATAIADSYKAGDRGTAFQTAILKAKTGDRFQIRTGNRGNGVLFGDGDITFSGMRIHE